MLRILRLPRIFEVDSMLCEKPMTMSVEEGEEIVRIAEKTGKICAENYCWFAHPMVRQARARSHGGA